MKNPTPSLAQSHENDLVARIRSGDRSAWEYLYDQHSVGVWKYVARLLGEPGETVAEVVQEVFLAAIKGIDHYDDQIGSVGQWLTGIAHRQVADHFRRKARHCREKEPAVVRHVAMNAQPNEVAENPVAALQQIEVAERVRMVLGQMSSEYAALLMARYMDRRSVQQLQELFGGSSNSIRSKLRRARAEFQRSYLRVEESGGQSND
ncbi:ECF RNA polymerase sigma factor SigW [Thalassoglobus neptunius]|uniref:ECF RNA polymerase sigma factor SigW n=1 Tax=Thalassoglobus neptunius TaxID=1938619 RepID=A0A5C5WYQ0_9PLAN|nr:sigma-70 family RNA polymerase sigma factor [Thalassoglobus neptunius]TWT55399.1 ECF RNA polymerase sigma factor SigW [Thalassoglobus neptunius]